jgi:hypothetical protein
MLLNSLCSCLHLTNYLKNEMNLSKEDLIDLIDFEGTLKEIPNYTSNEFAAQYLTITQTYVPLKIDLDTITNEKRYTSLYDETRLNATILSKQKLNQFLVFQLILIYFFNNFKEKISALNTDKNVTAKDKAKINKDLNQKLKHTKVR